MAGNPFLLAPEVNANPLLSDSWSRCQRYGLDPATEDFPRLGAGELADRLASHRGLQQLAQPVVEALSRQVADLQSVVILSDPDGLVLHTLGDTQALQKAQRVALAPGNLWSESGRRWLRDRWPSALSYPQPESVLRGDAAPATGRKHRRGAGYLRPGEFSPPAHLWLGKSGGKAN